MKVPTIGESITEVTLSQWLKKDGEYVNIDESICEFESDKATLEFPAEASGKLIYVAAEDDDLEIGALVAKIDTSVSASTVTGTGKGGRITQQDVQKVEAKASAPAKEAKQAIQAPTLSASTANFSREERTEKMSRMRRTIASRLVSAKNNTAMLTTFNEVDLSEVMKLRKKYQEKYE